MEIKKHCKSHANGAVVGCDACVIAELKNNLEISLKSAHDYKTRAKEAERERDQIRNELRKLSKTMHEIGESTYQNGLGLEKFDPIEGRIRQWVGMSVRQAAHILDLCDRSAETRTSIEKIKRMIEEADKMAQKYSKENKDDELGH